MGLLSKENVLQIHSSILKKFGGGEGILNAGMLDSALNSGLVTFDNQELFPSLIEKIVRISHGLISNHAFVDGNKRVGIAYLIISMRENNIQVSISHKDLIGIGYAVGAGQMSYEEMLFKVKNQNENFKLHLNESLFEEYNDNNNNEQLYREIASQVRKEFIDKYKDFLNGKCIEASERIVQILSENNIKASTVEGWVQYDDSTGCSDRDYDEHTWVETEDGYVIDVTATQFNNFMDEKYPDIIISEELPHGYSYDEPDNYLDDCSDEEWSYKSLIEAKKKRKKKKISQINPGEAIFKSVKDMQKWVKKRQKGWGSFVHIDNCGNMDYNNDMFNKMHGMTDASSSSTIDGGASDAAPSGGETSVGMGESLEMNKDTIKVSPNLIQFIKENKEIINNEDWKTLTKKSSVLSFSDEANLYVILNQMLAERKQP